MLNIKLALKFIIKKPLQYLLLLFVVIIGVTIFYFIFNAGDGLKKVVLQATAENNSYITVSGEFEFNSYEDENIKNFRENAFKNDSRITDISFSLSMPASLNRISFDKSPSILIKGVDFDEGANIQSIKSRIQSGKNNKIPEYLDNNSNYFGELVIGNKLASSLGFNSNEHALNKPIKLNIITDEKQIETYLFKIVAVYNTDQLELSSGLAFTNIETLHKIEHLKNKSNSIEIVTTNPLNSDDVQFKLNNTLNKYFDNYQLTNWQEGNKYIVNALYIEDISILLIQIFTALAISLGLASIIALTVRQRQTQIGILKALGLTNLNIVIIFLIQILFIMVLGLYVGLNFGNYLSVKFMTIFKRPNSKEPLVRLTVGLFNKFSLTTILTTLFSSLLAAIIPLKMAENLEIIEIIKSE